MDNAALLGPGRRSLAWAAAVLRLPPKKKKNLVGGPDLTDGTAHLAQVLLHKLGANDADQGGRGVARDSTQPRGSFMSGLAFWGCAPRPGTSARTRSRRRG